MVVPNDEVAAEEMEIDDDWIRSKSCKSGTMCG